MILPLFEKCDVGALQHTAEINLNALLKTVPKIRSH